MDYQIKVLDQYVLVKQTMRKKKGKIILEAAKSEQDQFDYKFEIVQLGKKCERELSVGDKPIFAKHVTFQGVKVINRTEKEMTSLVIVHEGDIIGVDLEPSVLDKVEEKA